MRRLFCLALVLFLAPAAHAQWLLVSSGDPGSVDQVEEYLTAMGATHVTETASVAGARSLADLSSFAVVYVAVEEWGGFTPLGNATFQASINGGALQSWLSAGGVMLVHAANNSFGDIAGPAGSTIYGYASTGTGVIHDSLTITDVDHEYITGSLSAGTPLVNGDFLDWGSTAHGQVGPPAGFVSSGGTNLGTNPTAGQYNVILSSAAGSSGVTSAMIEYVVGTGYVMLDAMTFDWFDYPPNSIVLAQQLAYVSTVAGLPTVAALDVDNGSPDGGTSLTLYVSGFGTDVTVTIGGQPAPIESVTSTQIRVTAPALPPGALYDIVVVSPAHTVTLPTAWLADFVDVPQANGFHDFVETIFRKGISGGCGSGSFCPSAPTTRAEMAVFLLAAKFGNTFSPPPATGEVFADVPADSFAASWIERLFFEGITAGCATNPYRYCPGNVISRAEMAVLLLRASLGPYTPPPATGGVFEDVASGDFAAPWIEQLYYRGISGGCQSSPRMYCPSKSTARGEMAVFLTLSFELDMKEWPVESSSVNAAAFPTTRRPAKARSTSGR